MADFCSPACVCRWNTTPNWGHHNVNELGKGHQITRTACAVVAAISLALTAVGVLTLADEEIQQTDLMEQQTGE